MPLGFCTAFQSTSPWWETSSEQAQEALSEEFASLSLRFTSLHGVFASNHPQEKHSSTSSSHKNEPKTTETSEKGSSSGSKKSKNKKEKGKQKESSEAAAPASSIDVQPPREPLVLLEEIGIAKYGYTEIVQSRQLATRTWTAVSELNESFDGRTILVRGRIHTSRAKGKNCFIKLRSGMYSCQIVMFVGDNDVTKEMVKWAASVPRESVVDIEGIVRTAPSPITSVTQQSVEISVIRMYCISQAKLCPPLLIDDASRADPQEYIEAGLVPPTTIAGPDIKVKPDVRLDNRVLDLRVPAHIAVFRMQSGVCQLFREFLCSRDFLEIHTPKLLGAASEGGSSVFEVKYFGGSAYLAQSPQLYKQMCVEADFMRVFEIGPVFRAEKSFTRRHMTEFVGLDLEMEIKEHYSEVLDVVDDMMVYIFNGLNERYASEISAVRDQYPSEPISYEQGGNLRLTFAEAVDLLAEEGIHIDPLDDIDGVSESALGRIVKRKFGTDFFILHRYPSKARPFYTMPCYDDPRYTNSYDIFLCGQEISSGAQRIHDPELLAERASRMDPPVDLSSMKAYVDAFSYGAWPHGGVGLGLERILMLFLGLPNVKKTSLFPRTPVRLSP